MNEVNHDLGISFRTETVTRSQEFLAQFIVIFDDAVMNQGDFIGRGMRMRITRVGHSMRGPPGMRNAAKTGQG